MESNNHGRSMKKGADFRNNSVNNSSLPISFGEPILKHFRGDLIAPILGKSKAHLIEDGHNHFESRWA